MKRTIRGCIILALALALIGCSGAERKIVRFKGSSFNVEVASSRQEQEQGLMFRRYLPPDSGMLFIFDDEAPQAFYMKNTYIPLDIIWMDRDKRVVFIKKGAKAADGNSYERISPQEKAMYVLELNSGTADKIGLKKGDVLRF